jgi:shikimate kinase
MSDAPTTGTLPNLVLEGFMGTGKSTVGAILAARLQWDFIDTDVLVEQDAGMTIKEIFARQGEAGFRAFEKAACLRAASRPFTVIATGGGALLDPESRSALESSGVVILLTCEKKALLARLEESARRGERPMIADNFEARVNELLHIRGELYSSIPLKVDTTDITPEEAASRVLELYGSAAQDWVSSCVI